ncbi:glycosyltransferase family 2 protein [Limimaricola pyoseonensis]|uniref:Glycosyltransferase 2-like domain-containing protein n=1 Tax=Limimaricola pyoseonensis TaxID=521013 RepID=A0A1G7KKJ5_9RHOB|nr:glycosyltransferase family 2 protein [Limimaricola pyoseonensis]SDF37666.1 hypothetical protein SAMN04488567_0236 [Limimaricola pyoseonensis]
MITASLVLYHNDPEEYGRAINSFLSSVPTGEIWVVDNSSNPLENALFDDPRVHYIYNGENLGFGRAHNKAISQIPPSSFAHLIVNPDIYFERNVVPELEAALSRNPEVGVVMPRISYPDGSLQRLTKLLPTPMDLIFRRFLPSSWMKKKLNSRYELHDLPDGQEAEIPSLSGCFILVRTEALRRIGGFDERYFMYMEDVDLVRRIGDFSKTLYVPSVTAIHSYAKGSYINPKLLKFHIESACKYFMKWGWFIDRQRSQRNAVTLARIANINNERKICKHSDSGT